MDNDIEKLFYEYGYVCGGIVVAGFCQFLNRLSAQEAVDKLLFVSRDGYIIHKIYREFFNDIDNEYLIFSRFASVELIFEDSPMEYINENIKTRICRVDTDNSISNILRECGLKSVGDFLDDYGLKGSDILTEKRLDKLTCLIVDHKDMINSLFKESIQASKKYYLDKIGCARKVCIVDLGWRGKSIMYLRNILRRYGWNGELIGALVGADNKIITQDFIRRGIIFPYIFKSPEERSYEKADVSMTYDEVICMEALFSSEADTLLRYKAEDSGEIGFIYGKPNPNREKIHMIHEGISDYCKQFIPLIKKYGLTVTPWDAYSQLSISLNSKKYQRLIRNAYEEVPCAMNGF